MDYESTLLSSRIRGHRVCLKSMSRTITMLGLTLAAITASQKRTLMLDLLKIMTKLLERNILVKSTRSQCVLNEYVKDNNYACLTLVAITASQQHTLMPDLQS